MVLRVGSEVVLEVPCWLASCLTSSTSNGRIFGERERERVRGMWKSCFFYVSKWISFSIVVAISFSMRS